MQKALFFILALLLVVSCKKDTPKTDLHLNYFGMQEGRYIIYDVTEITQDHAINQSDTLRYQLKTYWADTFVDNNGKIAREFIRYKRDSASAIWNFADLWTGYIDNNTRGEIVEENQRIIKAVFQPSFNKTWDANAYNPMEELILSYSKIHTPYTTNGINFDSTITITSNIEPSLIDTTTHQFIYATNVGLIEKSIRSRQFQLNSSGFYLNKGREVFYRFVETGIE